MLEQIADVAGAVIGRGDVWLLFGLLLAWLVTRRVSRHSGVPPVTIDLWFGVCLAIVFLTLLAVTVLRDGLAPRPWTYWLRPRGDVTVAFLALAVTTVIVARACGVPCAALADAGTPGVLLTIVCARIGCFMRGCCWGDVCGNTALLRQQLEPAVLARVQTVAWVCGSNWPLRVQFPRGTPAYTDQMLLGLMPQPALRSLPCHPVQLYEAVLVTGLALALLWYHPRRPFPWRVASVGLGGYALLRFFLEFLRADHAAVLGGLTLVQLIAAPCAVTAAIWWLAARRGRRRAGPARPTSPARQR